MAVRDGFDSEPRLVIVGARGNLTNSLQERTSVIVVPTAQMLNAHLSFSIPKNLPLVINAFQPATQLADLTDPVAYVDRSLLVLARALAWAKSVHCSKIIYTSSAVVYGENGDCREDDAIQIHGLHSALKAAAEQLTSNYASNFGLDYTIVRLFNLYGGLDQFSVIYRLLQAVKDKSPFQLINSGNALRDFTHVFDATNAYLGLLERDSPRILNVGSGRGISVSNLIQFISELGIKLEIENTARDEVNACVANIERLERSIDVDSFKSPFTYLAGQIQP
jgi:nucleoside-diphosphate-sugar epimerase